MRGKASASRGGRAPPGNVRVIGGRWKRTPLAVVDVAGLRPTPDRVRETVFNWIGHVVGNDLAGRSAIDLFAGSGALGVEAASRNAAPVTLVETHPAAVEALLRLRDKLGGDAFEVMRADAVHTARSMLAEGRRFDLVFLDPPFETDLLREILPLAAALCSPTGFVYVESRQPLILDEAVASMLEPYRADSAGAVFYHLLQRKIT